MIGVTDTDPWMLLPGETIDVYRTRLRKWLMSTTGQSRIALGEWEYICSLMGIPPEPDVLVAGEVAGGGLGSALVAAGFIALDFDPGKHPRAEHGHWASVGDFVQIHGVGHTGRVTATHEGGAVDVATHNGPTVRVELGAVDHVNPTGTHRPTNAERKALRVPPAWVDVTMANDLETADVLASGRDSKGRVQAIRSAKHDREAAASKFKRINQFAAKMPQLDQALKQDVATNDAAAAVLVMRRLGIRVGSTSDTHAKQQAYGATTLQARHVSVVGNHSVFDFIGKKGVHIRLETDDSEIAVALGTRLDGKHPDDPVFTTTEQQTIKYLRKNTGPSFKNHDLRTHLANVIAQREANKNTSQAATRAEFLRRKNAVGDVVAAQLANNRSEALKSYVNPEVFRQWDPTDQFSSLTAAGVWTEALHPRGHGGKFAPESGGGGGDGGDHWPSVGFGPGTGPSEGWTPSRSPADRFGNYAATNATRQKTIDRIKAEVGDPEMIGKRRVGGQTIRLEDNEEVKRMDGLVRGADERVRSLKNALATAPDQTYIDIDGNWHDGKSEVQANMESEQRSRDRLQASRDETYEYYAKDYDENGNYTTVVHVVVDTLNTDLGPGPETLAKVRAIKKAGKAIRIATDKTMEGNPAQIEYDGITEKLNDNFSVRRRWIHEANAKDQAALDEYAQEMGYKSAYDLWITGTDSHKSALGLRTERLAADQLLDPRRVPIREETKRLEDRRLELWAQIQSDRRDTLVAMLAAHRPLGGELSLNLDSIDEYDHRAVPPARKALAYGAQFYPTAWVAKLPKLHIKNVKRGYFASQGRLSDGPLQDPRPGSEWSPEKPDWVGSRASITAWTLYEDTRKKNPGWSDHQIAAARAKTFPNEATFLDQVDWARATKDLPTGSVLALSPDGDGGRLSGQPAQGRVATHELGHVAEMVVPGLKAAEWAYYWMRTSTGDPGHRHQPPKVWVGGEPDEKGRQDKFKGIYSGKEYNDSPSSSWELFTTGMESLFAGSGFTQGDTDFEDFILGTLAVL